MMPIVPAAVPAFAADALMERIRRLAGRVRDLGGPGDLACASVAREAMALMSSDPVSAHKALGLLALMRFDAEQAMDRVRILRQLGARLEVNLLLAHMGIRCGRHRDSHAPIAHRQMNATAELHTVRAAASVMRALGADDADLARVLETASGVLRERGLVWLDRPQAWVLNDEDGQGPGMSYVYRVDVTPDEAAALNWELAGRLADLDLDARLNASFIGVRA